MSQRFNISTIKNTHAVNDTDYGLVFDSGWITQDF